MVKVTRLHLAIGGLYDPTHYLGPRNTLARCVAMDSSRMIQTEGTRRFGHRPVVDSNEF